MWNSKKTGESLGRHTGWHRFAQSKAPRQKDIPGKKEAQHKVKVRQRQGLNRGSRKAGSAGARAAEATLGAPAKPLAHRCWTRGLPVKAGGRKNGEQIIANHELRWKMAKKAAGNPAACKCSRVLNHSCFFGINS